MLSIKKIQEMRANKKRKGFSFMEILVALIMIVSLSVGAFFTYSDAQQTRKMAQMHSDMDALVTGILVYEALHIESQLPPNLAALRGAGGAAALAAEDAVDGVDHTNFVTSVKADFTDPWGNSYETGYDAANRTLSCTPKQADMNEDGITVVKHF